MIRVPISSFLHFPAFPQARMFSFSTALDEKRDIVVFKLDCELDEDALLLLKYFLHGDKRIGILDPGRGVIAVPRSLFWEVTGKIVLILPVVCGGVDVVALAESVLRARVESASIEFMSEVDGEAIIIASVPDGYDEERARILSDATELEIIPLEE